MFQLIESIGKLPNVTPEQRCASCSDPSLGDMLLMITVFILGVGQEVCKIF